ncbi:MAG: 3-hydroxyacyl-[acyl-carrier-protein] dehydratase FabZ, partial [Casimicrobiaceae bacterium]
IDECLPGQSARAQKSVTINEPYFQGHFPGYPVMPGVLVLEALVQLSIFLAASSGLPVPTGIRTLDNVRFKRQVTPGDRMTLESTMQADGRFDVRATVEGELATEATFVLAADP